MDSTATVSVRKGKKANKIQDDTSRDLENGEHVKSYHPSNSFEVLADDKVMPNHKKEKNRDSRPRGPRSSAVSKSKGGRKVLEALNDSGNRYEVLGDDELMQGHDMDRGSKSEELLNGNDLSAEVVQSGLRKMRLKSEDESESSSSKKVNVSREPPKDCSYEVFMKWLGEIRKGMDFNEFMAFIDTLPKYPVHVPEDNQWRRIEGPGYTCSYPPPYLRGGKGPDLALFFSGRKLSKIERDIIEDKKTYYKITERELEDKKTHYKITERELEDKNTLYNNWRAGVAGCYFIENGQKKGKQTKKTAGVFLMD